MGLLDRLKRLRREREQLTVELAEVATGSEVRETEERIEAETERHGEHTPPPDQPAS